LQIVSAAVKIAKKKIVGCASKMAVEEVTSALTKTTQRRIESSSSQKLKLRNLRDAPDVKLRLLLPRFRESLNVLVAI